MLEPDLVVAVAQWPAFAPAALGKGVQAAFAFPLRIGAIHVGVLSLYRDTPGDIGDADLRDAIALSHIATHLVLDLEANLVPGTLPERLAEIVDHRAQVHQATGMIAAQLGTDVATALGRLRAFAWSRIGPSTTWPSRSSPARSDSNDGGFMTRERRSSGDYPRAGVAPKIAIPKGGQ